MRSPTIRPSMKALGEMMFGRKPKIPIDILLPNTEKHDREPILKEFKVIDDALGEVTVLKDTQIYQRRFCLKGGKLHD